MYISQDKYLIIFLSKIFFSEKERAYTFLKSTFSGKLHERTHLRVFSLLEDEKKNWSKFGKDTEGVSVYIDGRSIIHTPNLVWNFDTRQFAYMREKKNFFVSVSDIPSRLNIYTAGYILTATAFRQVSPSHRIDVYIIQLNDERPNLQ